MKKLVSLAVLAMLLLSGCFSQPAEPTDQIQADDSSVTTADQPATDDSQPTGDDTVAFGSTYTWQDGLSVTVSKPKPFKPSDTAAGGENYPHAVIFEVTLVNKTGSPFDPALFHATVQSANQEGGQIFDSATLRDMPMTKILNGRQVKFTMAFGVADPKDLVMELQPDFGHDGVLFQTK